MSISTQLSEVLSAITAAAQAAGRSKEGVRLVAVSKTYPVEAVREAAAAGQVDFGENRVQEMVEKWKALPDLRWHMIGSLQRNKVRQIAPFVHLIHSVDSEGLLQEIDRQAAKCQRQIDVLLQLNISDEVQKGGFDEDEAEAILRQISQYPHVRVRGLMGMAAFTDDRTVIRSQFQRLQLASARYSRLNLAGVEMTELSMGMSGDFDIAIAEGATLVRIGSSIFGQRNSH